MLKRVALSQVQTGDRRLAGVLAALAAEAGDNAYPLHNIATFVFEDGKALFAGLGADEHTEFEIGSVTKTFNADLLEHAIELGEATPGTTVEEVFGERVSGTPVSPVTLEELANHTSGLPRTGKQKLSNKVRAVLGLNPDVGITVDDVIDQAVAAQVEGRGTENYSNLGHDLLGLLLAESAGTNYPGLIKQRVLNPLGMGETYVALPGTVAPDKPRGVSWLGWRVQAWEMDGTAPSGGVRSTTTDMARYAAHALERDNFRFTWNNIAGTGLYWHNGGTFGFSSMLLLDTDKQRASFVVADSYTDIESFAFELLELEDPAKKK